MLHTRCRPASADAANTKRVPVRTSRRLIPSSGHGEVEDELLLKIAMLRKYQARNVKALSTLRRNTPAKAWEDGPQLCEPDRVTGSALAGKTPDGPIKKSRSAFETRTAVEAPRKILKARRTVAWICSSVPSSSKMKLTTVEPFRGMEASTSAWNRKIARQREV